MARPAGARELVAAALAAALCCRCGPAPEPAEPPHGAPVSEPPPVATAAPQADAGAQAVPPTADADAVVARSLAFVAGIRELPAKTAVKGSTISRDQMVEHVKKQLKSEIPERVIRAQNVLLFGLDLVPESFDYEQSLLELMLSQLAGLYDPKDKVMYLSRDLAGVERDATLAHELVHALQDQHYDLAKRIAFREDATDEQSAVHALAEGDATSAMLDFVLAGRGGKATDISDELISLEARGAIEVARDAAGVPSILKRSVIAPYVDGVVFVHWARRRGGWAGVDAAWRDPPTTTEQLLHPQKLLRRELAEAIAEPVAHAGGPTERLYRDVLGEQSLRLLFEEWMPRKPAVEAASDWAGDRIAVFQSGQRAAVAWHVRYDTVSAAQRGLLAFARGVARPEGATGFSSAEASAKAVRGDQLCRERKAAGPFALVRRGRDIGVVGGPYDATPGGARSAATCKEALRWARAVAAQR